MVVRLEVLVPPKKKTNPPLGMEPEISWSKSSGLTTTPRRWTQDWAMLDYTFVVSLTVLSNGDKSTAIFI